MRLLTITFKMNTCAMFNEFYEIQEDKFYLFLLVHE